MAIQKDKDKGVTADEVNEKVEDNKKEEQEAKAAKKARREQKDKAFKFLKSLADAEGADPNFTKALKILRPSLYGERTGGGATPGYIGFIKKVEEAGPEGLNEMDVFKQFKIGRREARNYLKKYLKSADPKTRVWINFDEESTAYVVVGTGIKPPQKYAGFIPVDESVTVEKESE